MHNADFYYKIGAVNLDSVHPRRIQTVDRVTLGMSLKSIDKLLNSGGSEPLDRLLQRARTMDQLLGIVRETLPEIDAAEIEAANFRDDGELVVVCRSPAWASRVRFESERILTAVRRHGLEASACRVRVGR